MVRLCRGILAIRPERSETERGRTSPKRLVGSVLKSKKTQLAASKLKLNHLEQLIHGLPYFLQELM